MGNIMHIRFFLLAFPSVQGCGGPLVTIHWKVVKNSGIQSLVHYADDYLLIGRENTLDIHILGTAFTQFCARINLPLAENKYVPPTKCLQFLGLEIDVITREIRAPLEKVQKAMTQINNLLRRHTVTLKQLQSVTGLLSFLCKPIPSGRTFLRRLFDMMSLYKAPGDLIDLSGHIREDLLLWTDFLTNFNGVCPFQDRNWLTNSDLSLFTDASSFGFGAIMGTQWTQGYFPQMSLQRSMAWKELFPVLVSVKNSM